MINPEVVDGGDYSSLIDLSAQGAGSNLDSGLDRSESSQLDSFGNDIVTSTPVNKPFLSVEKRKWDDGSSDQLDVKKIKEDLDHMTASFESLKESTVSKESFLSLQEQNTILSSSLEALQESYNQIVRSRSCSEGCPTFGLVKQFLERKFKDCVAVPRAHVEMLGRYNGKKIVTYNFDTFLEYNFL